MPVNTFFRLFLEIFGWEKIQVWHIMDGESAVLSHSKWKLRIRIKEKEVKLSSLPKQHINCLRLEQYF
jgi:hypothetical protein